MRVGSAQRAVERGGKPLDDSIAVQVFEQDDKFIAAQPGDDIVLAELMAQRFGHVAQHVVPLGVPHRVVDLLEVI